ncbi:MAG: hypothetical protein ACT6UH_09070 [Hydrogenophaga sp.]|uniref:hypothetical protein n=1 Tax=Hydrogenophaga sp. TaxID=1904254 RepID=UPI004035C3E9
MGFFMWWSLSAVLSALVIVIDMRRLGASRVGLGTSSWVAASVALGPLAVLAYLFKRPAARRQLVEAVWRLIGGDSHPVSMRRARLDALHRSGIVGSSIYKACLNQLKHGSNINSNPGDTK